MSTQDCDVCGGVTFVHPKLRQGKSKLTGWVLSLSQVVIEGQVSVINKDGALSQVLIFGLV